MPEGNPDLVVFNTDEEKDEPSLSKQEEEVYEQKRFENAEAELKTLFDRVKNVKTAIEKPEFYDIFIQPIKGNIESIKSSLETEEKTREIALKQGALIAYRKMLNFPNTAVDAFNNKLDSLKQNMPLFISDSDFARNVVVSFDEKEFRINIRGV